MKKTLSIVLAIMLLVSMLAGCGGSSEPLGCEGNYITMAYSMFGVTMAGEDATGTLDITLEVGGKGTITADDNTGSMKWTLEGEALTITVDGEKIAATLKDDTIQITNFLDTGMDVTLALEGSAAADPALYLPEEEKDLLGTWYSYAVADVLGEDMSDEIHPEAFGMTLNADHTGTIGLGEDDWLEARPWSMLGDWGSFDEKFVDSYGDEVSISFEFVGEDLEVTYSDTSDYYMVFTCAKAAE